MSAPKRETNRIAVLLAFALLYALASFVLKTTVHLVYSDSRGDTLYRVASVAGIVADLGIGCLIGAAAAAIGNIWISCIVGSLASWVGLFMTGAGAHYHAAHNLLPGKEVWGSIDGLNAFADQFGSATPVWVLLTEVFLFAAVVGGLAPRMTISIHNYARLSPRRSLITLLTACAMAGFAATLTGLVLKDQPRYGMTPAIVHSVTRIPQPPAASASTSAHPQPNPKPEPQPEPEPKPQPPPKPQIEDLSLEELAGMVQQSLAPQDIRGVEDTQYPYCRLQSKEPQTAQTPRNIIVVVLENLGAEALELANGGEPLMPNLRQMADEGLFFRRFFASGNQLHQGLVGLFAGIPPSPMGPRLDRVPMPRLGGLPKTLGDYGFKTLFTGGSELSAHQMRHYLAQSGFAEISEPNLLRDRLGLSGALSSEKTFAKFKRVARNHNHGSGRNKPPYFAVIHTAGALRRSVSPSPRQLAQADRALGKFYAWYLKKERPKNTVLIVTSSHASPLPVGSEEPKREADLPRFRVPLLVLGLTEEERQRLPEGVEERLGGHLDLPQTVLGLLGIAPTGCFQGRDLLFAGDWPEYRRAVSVGGGHEQGVYFHEHSGTIYEVLDDGAEIIAHMDSPDGSTKPPPTEEEYEKISELYRAFFALNTRISLKQAYAPGSQFEPLAPPLRKTIPLVTRPFAVSWMGRTAGKPCPSCAPDGSMRAILNALRAGFGWALLDLQLSKDAQPVISQEQELPLRRGNVIVTDDFTARQLAQKTLGAVVPLQEMLDRYRNFANFVLEIPTTGEEFRDLALSAQTLRLIRKVAWDKEFILTSPDRRIATLLAHHGKAPAAFQMPEAKVESRWLDYAVLGGFQWVQINIDFIDAQVIDECHKRGLKVIACGIDKKIYNKHLKGAVPDAIIVQKKPGWLKKRKL